MSKLKTLQEIFDDQRRFNETVNGFRHSDLTPNQRTFWTKEFCLLMFSEIDELLRCTAFKAHRKEAALEIKSNATEEIIDIFKYVLSLALVWGITPEQLIEEYMAKSQICELRWQQEMLLKRENVAVIDIDGVLCDYKRGLVLYMNKRLGLDLDPEKIGFLDHETAGIGLDEYETVKHDFRQLGIKRTLPTMPGAVEFTQQLRQAGYTIVLLSSRPYKKYRRIFKDTLFWLDNNGFAYDGVFWEVEKHETVLAEFGTAHVRFALEDDPKFAAKLAGIGLTVYLFDANYNQDFDQKGVVRVKRLSEILEKERGE